MSCLTDGLLVLSLFPGIGLLDRAFEECGFTVVRGPDPLWGGDIRNFHAPAGVFDGVIGGPPCQMFSRLRYLNPLAGQKQGNLIPEYERICSEAQPRWFLMENVPQAPEPDVPGYVTQSLVLNNRWVGGEQNRVRRFSFGTVEGIKLHPDVELFEPLMVGHAITASSAARVPVRLGGSGKPKATLSFKQATVMAGHGPVARGQDYETNYSMTEMCELQGLPGDFADDLPFTAAGKRKVVGNGVPLPLGKAIARAVKRAMEAS